MNDMNPQDDAYSPDGSRSNPDEPVFDFPAGGDTPAEHNEPHDDGPYHGISFDDSTLGTLSMHDEFSGLTSDGSGSAADDQDVQISPVYPTVQPEHDISRQNQIRGRWILSVSAADFHRVPPPG